MSVILDGDKGESIGFFFFSSRRRHTRSFHVTGVQTCALPISGTIVGKELATVTSSLHVQRLQKEGALKARLLYTDPVCRKVETQQ